jgi:hypothetical protein
MAVAEQQRSELGSRPRRHIFIGGTGRAGTSFLVRYLAEPGLDTQLSRCRPNAGWDNAGNSGLAIGRASRGIAYVVKSPWLLRVH